MKIKSFGTLGILDIIIIIMLGFAYDFLEE